MDYFIKNTTLINEGKAYQASVLIEDGIIKRIIHPHKFINTKAQIINGFGLLLLPGIIDTHVHFRDPGYTYKGDFESESKAAVAGGVTTVVDMPNTLPQTISEKDLDEKIDLVSKKSRVNYGFMLGATNENIQELLNIPHHKFAGFKVFFGSSTGNMLINREEAIEELFAKSKKVIVAHCEDENIIKENTKLIKEKYGENPPPFCHSLIRDENACYSSTLKAVEYAKKGNAHLHIAHLSTKKELEYLQNQVSNNITAEACVNYLWFDQSFYSTEGNRIKCNPSLKSEEDKKALIQGLFSPTLYTVGTDHAPHLIEEKEQPYFSSPSGIPSIQFSLQMMFELHHQGLISIETIVEKMCHNPAKLFKIKNRGFIREGYFADLVLIDLNSKYKVTEKNIYYKSGWSPLNNTTLHSKVKTTFVNGEMVFNEGAFSDHLGMSLLFE